MDFREIKEAWEMDREKRREIIRNLSVAQLDYPLIDPTVTLAIRRYRLMLILVEEGIYNSVQPSDSENSTTVEYYFKKVAGWQ